MYAYPSRFPDDVLEIINLKENICKYIDIPIQHISDNVLKSMRRGITKKSLISLLEKIRKEIPGLAIRTTLLVGYPDESEKDFEELLQFVKDFRFDRLGVFPYSNEDGTFAADIPDRVPKKEKLLRQKLILEAQKKIALKHNEESVSKIYKVLIDRKEGEFFVGRTYKDAPEIDQEVFVEANHKLKTGEFCHVKIYDFEEFDLFGEVIKFKNFNPA